MPLFPRERSDFSKVRGRLWQSRAWSAALASLEQAECVLVCSPTGSLSLELAAASPQDLLCSCCWTGSADAGWDCSEVSLRSGQPCMSSSVCVFRLRGSGCGGGCSLVLPARDVEMPL